MKNLSWWKYGTLGLLAFVLIAGLMIDVPKDVGMLDHTIRNLFYHVPMWFTMILLLLCSWILSMMYLQKEAIQYHQWSYALAMSGIIAGLCGITTGMLWANVTWGAPWTRDPKLNGAAIGMLIYLGYWLLGSAIPNAQLNRKVSAMYNVFVFPIFFALIWVMPKLSNFSIHPGSGDTVGFNQYDLNNNMRTVFYPAIIAWFGLFLWISEMRVRISRLQNAQNPFQDPN